LGGALDGPSSYFMKSPPTQYTDEIAHQRTEAFIAGTALNGKAEDRVQAATAAEGSARR
jgi:myo-inositol-1-phosphate synthase